jgi:hypothetical protein
MLERLRRSADVLGRRLGAALFPARPAGAHASPATTRLEKNARGETERIGLVSNEKWRKPDYKGLTLVRCQGARCSPEIAEEWLRIPSAAPPRSLVPQTHVNVAFASLLIGLILGIAQGLR